MPDRNHQCGVVVDTTDDASLTESSCALNYVSVTARFRRFPDRSFGLIDVHDVFDRTGQSKKVLSVDGRDERAVQLVDQKPTGVVGYLFQPASAY